MFLRWDMGKMMMMMTVREFPMQSMYKKDHFII